MMRLLDNGQAGNRPDKKIWQTILPCLLLLCVIMTVWPYQPKGTPAQTPYFFLEDTPYVQYTSKYTFTENLPEKSDVLINKMTTGSNGILYSVKINCDTNFPARYAGYTEGWDRLQLGYFYVTKDKIYLIRNQGTADRFMEEELMSLGTLVCQETDKTDAIANQKGWHEYIIVHEDICEFHSYNDLVETGFYETFIWKKDEGLIYYHSGYGAERDGIELTKSY